MGKVVAEDLAAENQQTDSPSREVPQLERWVNLRYLASKVRLALGRQDDQVDNHACRGQTASSEELADFRAR